MFLHIEETAALFSEQQNNKKPPTESKKTLLLSDFSSKLIRWDLSLMQGEPRPNLLITLRYRVKADPKAAPRRLLLRIQSLSVFCNNCTGSEMNLLRLCPFVCLLKLVSPDVVDFMKLTSKKSIRVILGIFLGIITEKLQNFKSQICWVHIIKLNL